MPPYGLYAVPRHHLYGQRTHAPKRPSFNSFDAVASPAKAVIEEAAQAVNDMSTSGSQQNGKRYKTKQNKHNDKKKKRRNSDSKKRKSNKEQAPIDTVDVPAKKRKRQSDSHVGASIPVDRYGTPGSFVAGTTTWLQKLKASVGDVAANFQQPEMTTTVLEQHPTVAKKIRKLNGDRSTAKAPRHEPQHGYSVAEAPSRLASKEDANRDGVPKTPGSSSGIRQKTPGSTGAPALKKTPIPLPLDTASYMSPRVNQAPRWSAAPSHVHGALLPVTPASRRSHDGLVIATHPIPFGFGTAASVRDTRSLAKKSPKALSAPQNTARNKMVDPLTPKLGADVGRSVIARKGHSMTAHNMLRGSVPLSAPLRPYSRQRASSVTLSSTSSGSSSVSSTSIKGGPTCFDPLDSDDSSTTTKFLAKQNKAQRKTRRKSMVVASNDRDHSIQKSINFTNETEYLIKHLRWRAEYASISQLPCLKKATGCSTKLEQNLSIAKENMSDPFNIVIGTEQDQAIFERSVRNSLEADTFLRNAIAAKVPVPIGAVEGIYSLFCPKYSTTHVDKYGFGQRTLAISRLPRVKRTSTYTARLSIPPRSMEYTMLAFEAPPHASFRVTTLMTSAEGYTTELILLGNGYLQLRVDLGQLLLGRKSEEGTSAGVMEFVGVKEKDEKGRGGAIEWVGLGDKGVGEAVAGDETNAVEVVEQAPKKKRGQPSNAKREKRVQEAAMSNEL